MHFFHSKMQSRLNILRFIELVVCVMFYSATSQSAALNKSALEGQLLSPDQMELLEYKMESNNSHVSLRFLRSFFNCTHCGYHNSQLCCERHQLCCQIVLQCPPSEDLIRNCHQTCPGGCLVGQLCCPRRRTFSCCTFAENTFKIPPTNRLPTNDSELITNAQHPNSHPDQQNKTFQLNDFTDNTYSDETNDNSNETEQSLDMPVSSETFTYSTVTPREKFDYVMEDVLIEQTTPTNFESELASIPYANESTTQQTATYELTALPTSFAPPDNNEKVSQNSTQHVPATNVTANDDDSWWNSQGSTSRNDHNLQQVNETLAKQTNQGFGSSEESYVVSYFPQDDDFILSKHDDSSIIVSTNQSDYENSYEEFDENGNYNGTDETTIADY